MIDTLSDTLPPVVVDRSPELARGSVPGIGGAVTVTVVVTANDIAEAKRGDGGSCALALALKRIWPGEEMNISGEHPTAAGHTLQLGSGVIEWIGRFDRGDAVEPLIIELSF